MHQCTIYLLCFNVTRPKINNFNNGDGDHDDNAEHSTNSALHATYLSKFREGEQEKQTDL